MSDFTAIPMGVTQNSQLGTNDILSSLLDVMNNINDFLGDSNKNDNFTSNISNDFDTGDYREEVKKQNNFLKSISENTQTLRKSGFDLCSVYIAIIESCICFPLRICSESSAFLSLKYSLLYLDSSSLIFRRAFSYSSNESLIPCSITYGLSPTNFFELRNEVES